MPQMLRSNAREQFEEANACFRSGEFETALSILDDLANAYPNNRHVLFPQARCYAELHRFSEALAVCDTLVEEANYEKARAFRSMLLQKIGEGSIEQDTAEDIEVRYDSDMDAAVVGQDELLELTDTTGGFITETDLESMLATARQSPAVWLLIAMSVLLVGATVWVMVSGNDPIGEFSGSLSEVPSSSNMLDTLLYRFGALGVVTCLLTYWLVNSLVLYAMLSRFGNLFSTDLAENVVDTLFFSLLVSLILPLPILGVIVEFVMLRNKYGMSVIETGITLVTQLAALMLSAALVAVLVVAV